MEVTKIIDNKFEINMEGIERGLCCCQPLDKVKIIGVIGPKESGKSFLLNYLIYNYDSKLVHGYVPIKNIIKETGAFYWGEGDTEDGIYMHMCYINNQAVMFLEANGDNQKRFVQLVSSHLIYNIKCIDDYDIKQLSTGVSQKMQRITVLIRDNYKLDVSNETIVQLQQDTRKLFDDVTYVILPKPFEQAKYDEFTGQLKHLDQTFIHALHQFRLNTELNTPFKTFHFHANNNLSCNDITQSYVVLQDIPNLFITCKHIINNPNADPIKSFSSELLQMKEFEKSIKESSHQLIIKKTDNKYIKKYHKNYSTYLKNKLISSKIVFVFIIAIPFIIFPTYDVIIFWYNSLYVAVTMAIYTSFLLLATRVVVNNRIHAI